MNNRKNLLRIVMYGYAEVKSRMTISGRSTIVHMDAPYSFVLYIGYHEEETNNTTDPYISKNNLELLLRERSARPAVEKNQKSVSYPRFGSYAATNAGGTRALKIYALSQYLSDFEITRFRSFIRYYYGMAGIRL
jgi:hypothetical protein